VIFGESEEESRDFKWFMLPVWIYVVLFALAMFFLK
jgi:hypothetical protein